MTVRATLTCTSQQSRYVRYSFASNKSGKRFNITVIICCSCCKGLSIMLLERLARDLEFHIQLYITADEQFGHADFHASGDGQSRGQPTMEPRWTGLVGDLLNGAAHMAVSAFSITRSRSRVIDFTVPYFTAGFSIVVSEKPRRPPIYAFMEPFDGWVKKRYRV
jgi:ABC-type amino acid transport substrate-binding protein